MRTYLILILAMARAALAQPGEKDLAPGKGIRIAVVQQDSNPGKPVENRNTAVGFARQALDQGADVVLFHEEMLVGCVSKGRPAGAGLVIDRRSSREGR